ncbi:dihydrodipicolinate synthase family protein [Nakamurella endophytica]|uniref:Dihydrodipicolinate synthase family protein n=1 Tax=Nakamurella endophytica TaxID=1748367 RepID=A0A917TA56_9ACTN|nr:dihydrodipicolinate synthase family protein [Nakamurella endophytica]GGM15533.1 hypothetical protein GCM10011594_39450 [Nakamurella endophytica]
MDRTDVSWQGYWPAAPTPFTPDGALDEAALTELMELYAGHRVDGVLVNGSTGEWFSQTPAERRRVAEVAVAAAAGRFPVVVGVSAYTAAEAGELARHAAGIGADGVLSTVPPYVHPAPAEVLEFYRAVSSATDLPFMVYNWPRGVAVDLDDHPDLLQRLADLPQVVAVKDSTGDWPAMADTVERLTHQVRVFGSFLSRRGLAILLGLGGDGNIDGGGVGAPFAVPYYRAVADGDAAAATHWVDRYRALSGRLIRPDYSGVFATPIPQLKAVMSILGQPGGTVRPPLLPVTDPGLLARLTAVVDDSGIRDAARMAAPAAGPAGAPR